MTHGRVKDKPKGDGAKGRGSTYGGPGYRVPDSGLRKQHCGNCYYWPYRHTGESRGPCMCWANRHPANAWRITHESDGAGCKHWKEGVDG